MMQWDAVESTGSTAKKENVYIAFQKRTSRDKEEKKSKVTGKTPECRCHKLAQFRLMNAVLTINGEYEINKKKKKKKEKGKRKK
jgi:hypothetical protein